MSARIGIPAARLALMAAAVMAARTGHDGEAMQKAKEDEAERADRRAAQREREEYRVVVNGPIRSRTKTYKPNGAREQERRRRQREKREARPRPSREGRAPEIAVMGNNRT